MVLTRRQTAATAAGQPFDPPSPVASKARARASKAPKPAASKAVKSKSRKAKPARATKSPAKFPSRPNVHKPNNRPPTARSGLSQIIDLYQETNAVLALLAFEDGETFTRFKYAAREERVVEISYDEAIDSGRLLSKTLVPGIMHACQESRDVGVKIYDSISFNGTALDETVLRTTFINWVADFVMIASEESIDHWYSSGRTATHPSITISKVRAGVRIENAALIVAVQKIVSEKSNTGNITFTKLLKPEESTKAIMEKYSAVMYDHKNLKLVGARDAARDGGSPMGDIMADRKKSDREVEKSVEKEIDDGSRKELYSGDDDGFDNGFEDEFESSSEQSFGEVTEIEQKTTDELLAKD